MSHNLIKFCEHLDKHKRYHESDSLTEYLMNLAKTKSLKHTKLKTNLPTQLLALEKAGVDTSRYYNLLISEKLTADDVKEINKKCQKNCVDVNKKDTDLHEYILWMKKEKEEPLGTKSNEIDDYLSDLRESFIDFLTDVVMKDFEKENEQITPQNLIDFYFANREDYESKLDNYDLMLGQTEGIISDEDFVDELSDDFDFKDDMIKRGEEI